MAPFPIPSILIVRFIFILYYHSFSFTQFTAVTPNNLHLEYHFGSIFHITGNSFSFASVSV